MLTTLASPVNYIDVVGRFTLDTTTNHIVIGQTETLALTATNTKFLHMMGFTSNTNTSELTTRVTNAYDTSTNFTYSWQDQFLVQQYVTIPKGRYTQIELRDALNTAIALNPTGKHTLSISAGKFVFTSSPDGFRLIPKANGNDMADTLGITTIHTGSPTTADLEPQYARYQSQAPSPPYMGGEKFAHVAIRELAQGNLIASTGKEYDVLTTVPLHATPYGQYTVQSAADLYTDDVDFPRRVTATAVEVAILDANYDQLTIPVNYNVNVQLKAYHMDTAFDYGPV